MWVSATVLSILIGAVWISSVRYNISTSVLNFVKAKDKGIEAIGNLKEDFNKNINVNIFEENKNNVEDVQTSSTIKIENTTSTNL